MGTAQLQGGLWAERAYYWATLMERNQLPFFETVLMKLALDSTTALLDIACGTGQFVQMAALHGAQVSGIDASAASIEIARQRVPSGNFAIGEMEELRFTRFRRVQECEGKTIISFPLTLNWSLLQVCNVAHLL